MKKYYLLTALAAAALGFSSCSSEDVVGENGNDEPITGNAITFKSGTSAVTRADRSATESAGDLDNNFVVCGYKGTATDAAQTGIVFDHYNVNYLTNTANTTLSNTANWEYVAQAQEVRGHNDTGKGTYTKLAAAAVTAQTIKYWDHSATSYDFLAFSMGKGDNQSERTYAIPTAVQTSSLSTAAYTLKGNATTLGECYISDITTVLKANYNASAVQMKFRHLTSKVRMALYETIPGYVVSAVKFRQTLTTSHEAATSTDGILIGTNAFNEKGTLTVYFPKTGTTNKDDTDYNKAHVSFTADGTDGTSSYKTFGAVDYKTVSEDAITTGSYLGLTSSTASYVKPNASGNAGDYLSVLPHENDSKVLSIQIDYTLTATDGSGETIQVYGAQADVPTAYTAWKPGYAYTYIFKISPNTNGHTGSSIDDKGLTALSFDAVVLDDENGKQETITTVADPSIITYQLGQIVNEYNAGIIYASVEGNPTLSSSNAHLYLVTGGTGTATESTAALAIAQGKSDNTSDVYDKTNVQLTQLYPATDDYVTSVPAADGNTLAVNALKWNATTGKTYVFEYVDGANKSYKVVKVQ